MTMTTPTASSPAIALWLAGIWALHKSERFLAYVTEIYGKPVDHLPSFECVYIAEAESGDLDTGQIGGIIKKWWMVDDTGLSEIRRPQLPLTDDPALFDQRPVLKFFTDGARVVFGERLGPDLICRKVGKLIAKRAAVSVADVRLLWTTGKPIGTAGEEKRTQID
jgi:hypothetical protein